MQIAKLENVTIEGICTCLPTRSEDNLARCTEVYGDAKKAESIVKATGIKSRRVLAEGMTTLDLSVKAAEAVLEGTKTARTEIGAVLYVTFTPERLMPCNACMIQNRLGLPNDILAYDINLACSGWAYGVYTAGLIARATGRKVLLLDGDTQTKHIDPTDPAVVPLLSDAGTATVIAPAASQTATWRFAFHADGAKGEALQLPFGGRIAMDGFAVFKFVTMDVLRLIQDFLAETGRTVADFDAFVPHQANIFMIQQIAKKLKFAPEQLKLSGDVLGNSSSATVPTTIAYTGSRGKLLVSGFGGGLSASVAELEIGSSAFLGVVEA